MESIKDVDDLEPDITPEAQIWKSYAEEAMQQDKDTIANWNQSMDVILVFVRVLFNLHNYHSVYLNFPRLVSFLPS